MDNINLTDKEKSCARMLLGVIEDIEVPMLMYQIEKDVVKKALILLLEKS